MAVRIASQQGFDADAAIRARFVFHDDVCPILSCRCLRQRARSDRWLPPADRDDNSIVLFGRSARSPVRRRRRPEQSDQPPLHVKEIHHEIFFFDVRRSTLMMDANALAGASPSLSCYARTVVRGIGPGVRLEGQCHQVVECDCRRRARRTCGCQCAEDPGDEAEVFETAPALGEIGAAVNVSPKPSRRCRLPALATKSPR